MPNHIGNSSFNILKSAIIDIYNEDLETRDTNVNLYIVLLEINLICGSKNDLMKTNAFQIATLDILRKYPEELFPNIHILLKILSIIHITFN